MAPRWETPKLGFMSEGPPALWLIAANSPPDFEGANFPETNSVGATTLVSDVRRTTHWKTWSLSRENPHSKDNLPMGHSQSVTGEAMMKQAPDTSSYAQNAWHRRTVFSCHAHVTHLIKAHALAQELNGSICVLRLVSQEVRSVISCFMELCLGHSSLRPHHSLHFSPDLVQHLQDQLPY